MIKPIESGVAEIAINPLSRRYTSATFEAATIGDQRPVSGKTSPFPPQKESGKNATNLKPHKNHFQVVFIKPRTPKNPDVEVRASPATDGSCWMFTMGHLGVEKKTRLFGGKFVFFFPPLNCCNQIHVYIKLIFTCVLFSLGN